MRLLDRIRGIVRVEICGAFPESLLNACAMQAVALWDLESADPYTLRATLEEKQLPLLEAAAGHAMCGVTVLSRRGGSGNLRFLRRRKWLLLAAALTLCLLLFSSLFIWEIRVQGCERLTEGEVLRTLKDCGVERGSFWPSLSADLVRSEMLSRRPELAWMTVNVNGSRATVLVVEREEKPEIYLEAEAADIIAGKTGVITGMSVRNGRPLVSVGQTVAEGETLVSAKMESIANPPRYVHAAATVTADTWYELTAVCPLDARQKGEAKRSRSRFAVKIGQMRVNFYPGGKKTLDGYDKIVHEYIVGLEGLFALPLRVVREELVRRESAEREEAPEREMQSRLYAWLQQRIDGEISSCSFSVSRTPELVYVTMRAQCSENIARTTQAQEAQASP